MNREHEGDFGRQMHEDEEGDFGRERERERGVVGISVVRCTEIWTSPLMA